MYHTLMTNMTLAEYVNTFPRLQRAAVRRFLASKLGISEVFVRSMCNGNKKIPSKYAIAIEEITEGAVSRFITAPAFYPPE